MKAPISKYLSEEEVNMLLNPPDSLNKPTQENFKQFMEILNKFTIKDLFDHHSELVQAVGGEEQFGALIEKIGRPYSNYGYQLLATIIGKQTQNSKAIKPEDRFRDHVEQRIFQPSGMQIRNNSIPEPYGIDENDVLQPMKIEENEPYPHGNGCWKVTTKDLIAFSNALNVDGKLIQKQNFDKMLKSNPPLGFDVDRDQENNIIGFGHPGQSSYGTAFLYTFVNREKSVTVAVLSNCPSGMDIKPAIEGALAGGI